MLLIHPVCPADQDKNGAAGRREDKHKGFDDLGNIAADGLRGFQGSARAVRNFLDLRGTARQVLMRFARVMLVDAYDYSMPNNQIFLVNSKSWSKPFSNGAVIMYSWAEWARSPLVSPMVTPG